MEALWLKLQAGIPLDDDLKKLPWPTRAVYYVIACHVKMNGNNRGRFKPVTPSIFAATYALPQQDVEDFLDWAIDVGLIVDEGRSWQFMDWQLFQSPDAQRKRDEKGQETKSAVIGTKAVEAVENGKADIFQENPTNSGNIGGENFPGQSQVFQENDAISRKSGDFPQERVERVEREQVVIPRGAGAHDARDPVSVGASGATDSDHSAGKNGQIAHNDFSQILCLSGPDFSAALENVDDVALHELGQLVPKLTSKHRAVNLEKVKRSESGFHSLAGHLMRVDR